MFLKYPDDLGLGVDALTVQKVHVSRYHVTVNCGLRVKSTERALGLIRRFVWASIVFFDAESTEARSCKCEPDLNGRNHR